MSHIRPAPEVEQALSLVTKGQYVNYGNHQPICPVTVTGKTPDSGKEFGHVLNTGEVLQLADSTNCKSPAGDALSQVKLSQVEDTSGLSGLTGNLSTLSSGDFFQYSGSMYRVVTPKDSNGDPIAPAEGKVWVHQLTASAITEMTDTTSVELRPGSPTEWVLANS